MENAKIAKEIRDDLCETWTKKYEKNLQRKFKKPETWFLLDNIVQYFLKFLIFHVSSFDKNDIDAANSKKSKLPQKGSAEANEEA